MGIIKTMITIMIIISIGVVVKMLQSSNNNNNNYNEYFCVAHKARNGVQTVDLDSKFKCDQHNSRNYSGQSSGSYYVKWHEDVNACQLNTEEMKFISNTIAFARNTEPPSTNKDKCESITNDSVGTKYEWTTKNLLKSQS
tara:strand:+ start:67 stop:486 length:420 start_codon:yes stop_codon:yes gene_type:complete